MQSLILLKGKQIQSKLHGLEPERIESGQWYTQVEVKKKKEGSSR
jgi:hypothetical protein